MVSVHDFLRPGPTLAVVCAVFLALTALSNALVRFNLVGEPIPPLKNYNSTNDPSYLAAKWKWQRSVFGYTLWADLTGTAGLLLLIFTANQLRKIYRSHEGVAHRAMYYSFVLAGLLPVFEFLQNLGVIMMADWMTDPNSTWRVLTNDPALQALDVAFTVMISRSLWVFSLANLFLCSGMGLEFYLEKKNSKGNGLRQHSYLAIAIACTSFIVWGLELASFWSPAEVLDTAGFMTLVMVAGLCAWCLWLAFRIFPNFDDSSSQVPMEYY